jgi:hypothetical protein
VISGASQYRAFHVFGEYLHLFPFWVNELASPYRRLGTNCSYNSGGDHGGVSGLRLLSHLPSGLAELITRAPLQTSCARSFTPFSNQAKRESIVSNRT